MPMRLLLMVNPSGGDFDAQEIFNKLGGDLKIKTVNVGFAAYYESVGRVDLMERHKDEKAMVRSAVKTSARTLQKRRPCRWPHYASQAHQRFCQPQ
jgi:ATP sulfurylase